MALDMRVLSNAKSTSKLSDGGSASHYRIHSVRYGNTKVTTNFVRVLDDTFVYGSKYFDVMVDNQPFEIASANLHKDEWWLEIYPGYDIEECAVYPFDDSDVPEHYVIGMMKMKSIVKGHLHNNEIVHLNTPLKVPLGETAATPDPGPQAIIKSPDDDSVSMSKAAVMSQDDMEGGEPAASVAVGGGATKVGTSVTSGPSSYNGADQNIAKSDNMETAAGIRTTSTNIPGQWFGALPLSVLPPFNAKMLNILKIAKIANFVTTITIAAIGAVDKVAGEFGYKVVTKE